MTGPPFAELVAASHFSFLRGASHPADMVARAIELGLIGIGIADRNTVAGVVRAHVALREARDKARARLGEEIDFRLVVGARLCFADDTPDIVAYPATRHGWGRLTRLLTTGNRRAKKGGCILHLVDLLDHAQDLLLIAMAGEKDEAALATLAAARPGALWIAATMPRNGPDRRRLARLAAMADRLGLPLLATADALYAAPAQRPLHDILTCIREKTTIHAAGRRLEANAERHLKRSVEMLRLFRDRPEAVAASLDILARISFTLDDLRYEYPHEPVPEGWDPQAWLEHLVLEAARARFSGGIPARMQALLDEEFGLIRRCNYAYYFLTVHDIVAFARAQSPPILCQGRGSAANSAVCFLLGITSVDPMKYDLLFSRFVSDERKEPPDIDVDFEHERREEVMQYIYRRYGRERAGIASTVIHYRPRSAVREVGKALGLTDDITHRLTSTVWGSFATSMDESRFRETGFSLDNPEIARLNELVGALLRTPFPRHLSQHVGGFVLTEDRLDETVPIHNAAMADRTFIEWDKDDIDALGLMKVDVLALGMLTCLAKGFTLLRDHGVCDHALDTLPDEDPRIYEMLRKGDSIGLFQVESRAQINMLPRLQPRKFYDLVIQVAIVRPGPIEGDMVHPYLRRRAKEEAVEYPSPSPEHGPADELESVLGKTEGVPLFQEQAMKLAIVAAKFSPEDANRLRRAMATFRNVGTIGELETKMIEGMVHRGYRRDFAERCYKQIQGFGSYGFPESHALSFARLVYASAWMKRHHPAAFCAAILNSQPMGFYAPAQLVRDAREHGVIVRAIDVVHSAWDNGLEDGGASVRLGFRQIDGFRPDWAAVIAGLRTAGAGSAEGLSVQALAQALPRRALRLLADADAFRSLSLDRREALWEVRRQPGAALPLFAAADARELGEEADAHLPAMPPSEHVAADYQMTRLSLKDHPMTFLRPIFSAERVLTCRGVSDARDGRRVTVAGVVLVRQRPGKGNAIFVTLEDETGITNLLLWARVFEAFRRDVMAARLLVAEGIVQKSKDGVVHLMVDRVEDRTRELGRLSSDHAPHIMLSRADEYEHPQAPRNAIPRGRHPRDVRVLPPSRDFH